MAVLPGDLEISGVPVGGLSGLAWDATTGTWLTVSDDAAVRGPARVYHLAIDLDNGRLTDQGLAVLETIELRDKGGRPYAPHTVDPEGITLLPDGTFYVSSEGNAGQAIPPFVRHFAPDGDLLDEIPLPPHVHPNGDGTRGVRQNTGLEALGLTADTRWLFTATESALAQDGPANDPDADSPARLLRYNRRNGKLASEHIYMLGPLPALPDPPDGIAVKGVTELLPLTENDLLVLERAYVQGRGNTVELYLATLHGASDISNIPSLTAANLTPQRPLPKHLVLDFATLGVPVDNLEGMALGPHFPDGRRLFIVVSDNNFNQETQLTQFLAFAMTPSS